MDKGPDGKNKVITDEFSSPIADPRFIFEMLVNFETIARNGEGGFVIPRKITHPAIRALLPSADKQISVSHGEALGAWCQAPAKPAPSTASTPTSQQPDDQIKSLARELWRVLGDICKGDKDWKRANQWLIDEAVLDTDESAPHLTAERFEQVILKAKSKLHQ